MRILFVLPGLHRVVRGAEVAFESIAQEIATRNGYDVTLIGAGTPEPQRAYHFKHAGCISRERFHRWPGMPLLRNDCIYEELSFVPGLLRAYEPDQYDVTVTCSYPYTNWVLRGRRGRKQAPAHVFVTQNGDWPAYAGNCEYKFFSCDGLVCTNPEYHQRNHQRWFSTLIPNGVDPGRFGPGPPDRDAFNLPHDVPVALMVSALIPPKGVLDGIRCAAAVKDLHLIVAGDGPQRAAVETLGDELMGPRFRRLNIPRKKMPLLYQSADVFLHMSRDEPSANAYIEALATGLPIVTHDRAVTRWTFEDQAILGDVQEQEWVVAALCDALELKSEDHVAARRELVKRRFDWSVIATDYLRFFTEVRDRVA